MPTDESTAGSISQYPGIQPLIYSGKNAVLEMRSEFKSFFKFVRRDNRKEEIFLAINTNFNSVLSAWVTIDNGLQQAGDDFRCTYSTNHSQEEKTTVIEDRNGKVIRITVPPAGFVAYTPSRSLQL